MFDIFVKINEKGCTITQKSFNIDKIVALSCFFIGHWWKSLHCRSKSFWVDESQCTIIFCSSKIDEHRRTVVQNRSNSLYDRRKAMKIGVISCFWSKIVREWNAASAELFCEGKKNWRSSKRGIQLGRARICYWRQFRIMSETRLPRNTFNSSKRRSFVKNRSAVLCPGRYSWKFWRFAYVRKAALSLRGCSNSCSILVFGWLPTTLRMRNLGSKKIGLEKTTDIPHYLHKENP